MKQGVNVWYWLCTICSSLLVLAILCVVLVSRWLRRWWLRRHPEVIVQKLNRGATVSFGFVTDVLRVRKLEARRKRDPRAIIPLIKVYERIIGRLQFNEDVFFYALTQNKLGNAYSELSSDDNAANLARAITCYQEALRFFTPEETPFEYASTQGSLGNAYWKLLSGDRAANLVQAIVCYQEALRFLTLEDTPSEYADAQNHLNLAYREMQRYTSSDTLEIAE